MLSSRNGAQYATLLLSLCYFIMNNQQNGVKFLLQFRCLFQAVNCTEDLSTVAQQSIFLSMCVYKCVCVSIHM